MPDLVYNVKFQIDDTSLQRVSQATTTVTGGTGTAESTKRDADKTKKSIRQIINEYALLGKETDNVTRKLKSSSSGFTQFNSSTDATAGKLEGLRSDLLPVITALEGIANSTEATVQEQLKARTTLSQLIGVYDRAGNASQAYATNQRVLAETMELVTNENRRMNASFSTSNQVLFSFSDGIQDASQFSYGFASGMRAIGNNIGFTGELFANLNRRVQEYNQVHGVGATSVTKELRNSLKGPAGVLLALNLAITAFTVISREIEKYKKRTEEAAGSTSQFTSAVKQFYDVSTSAGLTELSRLEKEVEFYQRRVNVLKEGQELSDQQTRLTVKLTASQNVYNEALQLELDSVRSKISENRELQRQFGIQQSDYNDLNSSLSTANANYRAFAEGTSESEVELALLVERIKDANTLLVNEYNLALDNSNVRIQDQIEYLKAIRNQYFLAAQAGRTELIPVINGISKEIDNLLKRTPAISQDIFQFDVAAFSASFNAGMGIFAADAELFNMQVAEQINGTMSLYQINEDLLRDNLEASAGIAQEFSNQLDTQTEKSVEKRAQLEWNLAQRRRSFIEQLAIFEATRNIKTVEDLQVAKDTELAIIQKQYEDELILKEEFEYRKAQIEDRYTKSSEQLADIRRQSAADVVSSLAQSAGVFADIFGASKEAQIAMAIIDGGAAIVKTFSQLGFPAGIPAAIAVAARTAQTIQQMKQTEIGSQQSIDSGGTASGKFGLTLSQVEGPQTFRTPAFTPTNGSMQPRIVINQELKADRKQLYILNKMGEEEYRQIKV